MKDSGTAASFSETFFVPYTLPLEPERSVRIKDMLQLLLPFASVIFVYSKVLTLEVWNESFSGKKKHVGSGRISLESIINGDGDGSFSVKLTYRKSPDETIEQGVVSFNAIILYEIDDSNPTELKKSDNIDLKSKLEPYEIAVTVHSANNLPIADITSSDPYVIIYLDDILLGKTKTISRNLNPKWGRDGQGESFSIASLHINKILNCYIYDSNTTASDVLLGVVSAPLSSFSQNLGPRKHSIELAEKFKNKISGLAELQLNVIIKRNDSLVRIIPDSQVEPTSQEFRDVVNMELSQSPAGVREAVEATLNAFKADSIIATFLEPRLIRDLMQDLRTIVSGGDLPSFEVQDEYFKRNQLKLLNARKIDLDTREESRFPPIEVNSLQLNLSADCCSFILLQLNNRFSLWIWTKWLLYLHDCWQNPLHESQIPAWAESGEFYGQVAVSTSSGLTCTGRGFVSRKRHFQLRLDDTVFDLSSLVSVVLSADSEVPKAYIVDVEIVSVQLLRDNLQKEKDEERTPSSGEDASHGAGRRKSLGILSSVRSAAQNVVSGARDIGVEVASGVASTTASAAKSIASGPITGVILMFS